MNEGIDPMDILSNDAMRSMWVNEGLPADRISNENAAIISNCARWPLIIDPQIQGSKWLKQKYDEMLEVINFGKDRWLNTLTNSIKKGGVLMIEKVGNELEPAVDPVLSRAVFTKGGVKYIKIGGDDIEYNDNFKLIVVTSLTNPHYKPEIAAQCTIINFIVTESGLEDQLLALVVKTEKPELEIKKAELVKEQNEYI